MKYKPLPIGIDDFKEIITKGSYYVDKTRMIKTLLDATTKVTLFTRPRRFGKSLNLSMLQYYFEMGNPENKNLFEGLHIWKEDEHYKKHMGQYPVVLLNFKEVKQRDFDMAYRMCTSMIASEFLRHSEILQMEILSPNEVEIYQLIQSGKADEIQYLNAIQFLTRCLEKTYGQKVIILVDEYDVPLENAYYRGFYGEMVDFVRGILSSSLKSNTSLAFAVMTGCLRISKESIFTGLNNLEIISIQNQYYGEYFGFTQEEVEAMLRYYQKEQHMEEIRHWYNGYLFGNVKVYNPWSLINHIKQLLINDETYPIAYWSNTSSNSIVKDLIERADAATKEELQVLVTGGEIEKPIQEDITYEDIYRSNDHLWNFLYFTGYLKKTKEEMRHGQIYTKLQIPNQEVKQIYEIHIMEWSREKIAQRNLSDLYQATLQGDVSTMEQEIKAALIDTISYYDGGESFYHGFLCGLYRGIQDYLVISNREFGKGRPDLVIMHPSYEGKAIVFEFKVASKAADLLQTTENALKQIKNQEYVEGVRAYEYTNVVAYGIGFYKKNCVIKKLESY